MSAEGERAAIGAGVGIAVAACAACCAGPILGALAAIGLASTAGVVLFGSIAALIGAAAVAFVLVRHRRRPAQCTPTDAVAPVTVRLTEMRTRS